MIYIDQEDKAKLHLLGIKILQMKQLKKEITEFFVTNGKANYCEAQDLLDVINLYIKGESLDYIGEQVFQSDGKPVKKLLQLMGLEG